MTVHCMNTYCPYNNQGFCSAETLIIRDSGMCGLITDRRGYINPNIQVGKKNNSKTIDGKVRNYNENNGLVLEELDGESRAE